MSHELRTPLNSIIGFSEVLQGIESLNDKQRRYASNIQKSGRLLLEMINDILDLAKVEAGKMEVRRSEFDLSRLVSAQCDMIHSLSEDKNISLSVEVPEDLPKAFQDPNKLGQIINNLLSNAIKFTPEGGMITVSVSDLDNGRFRISRVQRHRRGDRRRRSGRSCSKSFARAEGARWRGLDTRVRGHRIGTIDRQRTRDTCWAAKSISKVNLVAAVRFG